MAIYYHRCLTSIVFAGFTTGFIVLAAVGCAPTSGPPAPPNASTPTPIPTGLIDQATSAPTATATPADLWLAVLQRMPYPYTTPLPPPASTALDGIYVKRELKEGTPVPCRRCPDYLPEGGLWRLNLDRGAYRIFHEVTGWYSLGSFTVSGDRLRLFNDPTCVDMVGVYGWELGEGELRLTVIEDACQVDRRGRSFANLAWAACRPPNAEAAITDHWPKPADCQVGQ